jgi:hypothetical protein
MEGTVEAIPVEDIREVAILAAVIRAGVIPVEATREGDIREVAVAPLVAVAVVAVAEVAIRARTART